MHLQCAFGAAHSVTALNWPWVGLNLWDAMAAVSFTYEVSDGAIACRAPPCMPGIAEFNGVPYPECDAVFINQVRGVQI